MYILTSTGCTRCEESFTQDLAMHGIEFSMRWEVPQQQEGSDHKNQNFNGTTSFNFKQILINHQIFFLKSSKLSPISSTLRLFKGPW